MKIKLKEYKFNEKVSVIEFWNDARKNKTIPKYEYHLRILDKQCFCFGCDSKFGDNVYSLMASGYFNPFIEELTDELLGGN